MQICSGVHKTLSLLCLLLLTVGLQLNESNSIAYAQMRSFVKAPSSSVDEVRSRLAFHRDRNGLKRLQELGNGFFELQDPTEEFHAEISKLFRSGKITFYAQVEAAEAIGAGEYEVHVSNQLLQSLRSQSYHVVEFPVKNLTGDFEVTHLPLEHFDNRSERYTAARTTERGIEIIPNAKERIRLFRASYLGSLGVYRSFDDNSDKILAFISNRRERFSIRSASNSADTSFRCNGACHSLRVQATSMDEDEYDSVRCGVEDGLSPNLAAVDKQLADPKQISVKGTGCLLAEAATEADYEFVDEHHDGDFMAANTEILIRLEHANTMLQNQLGLRLEVIFQHTWSTPDPYEEDDYQISFGQHWEETFRDTYDYDLAHMFSGFEIEGIGGQASGWVCTGFPYSTTYDPDDVGYTFWDNVPAHEIGHQFGSQHDENYGVDHDVSCFVMAGGQGLCEPISRMNQFSEQSLEVMIGHLGTHSCLSPDPGCVVSEQPSHISGLSASSGTDVLGVELDWNYIPQQPSAFLIRRRPISGGEYEVVGTTRNEEFFDRKLPGENAEWYFDDTQYYYQVTRTYFGVESIPTFVPGWGLVPEINLPTPQIVYISDLLPGGIDLFWEPMEGVERFCIDRYGDDGGFETTNCAIYPLGSWFYNIDRIRDDHIILETDPLPQEIYAYRIRAISDDGASLPSQWHVGRGVVLDEIPQNVQATTGTYADRVRISWDEVYPNMPALHDPVVQGIVYQVRFSPTGEAFSWDILGETQDTFFDHTDLLPDSTYFYRVRATRGGVNGEWGEVIIGTTNCNTSCQEIGWNCGSRCGGALNCGICQSGFECNLGQCEPECLETCENSGFECGWQELCGDSEYCGSCSGDLECNSGSCEPPCTNTCESEGFECGWQEICGYTQHCGSCQSGLTCMAGSCVDVCEVTCNSAGYECGVIDSCGQPLDCGQCANGLTCESGQCVEPDSCGNGVCEWSAEETCSSCEDGDCGGSPCFEDCGVCESPIELFASQVDGSPHIQVTWTAPLDMVQHYLVFRSPEGPNTGFDWIGDLIPGAVNSYLDTDPNLQAGVTYFYRLKAVYPINGWSEFSDHTHVTLCSDFHHEACFNNDIYWFNSCNIPQALSTNCSGDTPYCEDATCVGCTHSSQCPDGQSCRNDVSECCVMQAYQSCYEGLHGNLWTMSSCTSGDYPFAQHYPGCGSDEVCWNADCIEACTDSDGGHDPLVRGTVFGIDPSNSESMVEATDQCVNLDQLQEFRCGSNNVVQTQAINCSDLGPYQCSNGECVELPCNLTNAHWSTSVSPEGSIVELTVYGDAGCVSREIEYAVYNDQHPLVDHPATLQPTNAVFDSWNGMSVATTTWQVEAPSNENGFTGYHYQARVLGVPGLEISSLGFILYVSSPQCGNGYLEQGEECDDGDTVNGDGCNQKCVIEFCGDGIVQPGIGEQCEGTKPAVSPAEPGCSNCRAIHIHSFLPGTKISMADRSLKNIEEIVEGDYVLTYDEESLGLVASRVYASFSHGAEGYYIFNNRLHVTATNPIWIAGQWKLPPEIEVGDYFFTDNMSRERIVSKEYVTEEVTVYNLSVEKTHNYFADGVLVHNKQPPFELPQEPGGTLG